MRSLAGPASALARSLSSLSTAMVQAQANVLNMNRAFTSVGEHVRDQLRVMVGLPPRSAVDRLAELVEQDHEG